MVGDFLIFLYIKGQIFEIYLKLRRIDFFKVRKLYFTNGSNLESVRLFNKKLKESPKIDSIAEPCEHGRNAFDSSEEFTAEIRKFFLDIPKHLCILFSFS
jgi:septation ring formation regulator EzrA